MKDPVKSGMSAKDIRTYAASAIFVLLVIMLMLFLTFIEIPTENKDLIVSIISMLVGGTGVAMGNLFGSHDNETNELKDRIRSLEAQYSVLKKEYDRITEMLISRHVVRGDGVETIKFTEKDQ